MTLGDRIKTCRLQSKMSQEMVAELVGVSRQAVTKWESNQSAPSTENLFRLAEIFGTSVDMLLVQEKDTQNSQLKKDTEISTPTEQKHRKILLPIAMMVVAGLALLFTVIMLYRNCSIGKAGVNKTLYDQGLKVISVMVEMSRSEEYIELYTREQGVIQVIQKIGAADYTEPKEVYAIRLADDSIKEMAELYQLSDASEEMQRTVVKRFFSTLMMQLNGMSGVHDLAATNLVTAGTSFVNKEITNDVIYLYIYPDAYPVAVTFVMGDDGVVSASGCFILYKEFPDGPEGEIEAFFDDTDVEITTVK